MDGILLVDKPQGFTSHDMVAFIRSRFNLKKVGHAGTLDPMATGLLIILIGKYTKHSSRFLNDDKEYDAAMILGSTSDTGDAWGNVRTCYNDKDVTEQEIEEVVKRFLGGIEQAVPSYSAKKFKGRKLYELARKGIEVKLAPQKVIIHSIDITDVKLPEISFKVKCSKGTYIRQLCMDIGSALGRGAYMSKLRRTGSGSIKVNGAVSIEELKRINAQSLEKRLKVL